jgi:transcriptional regulator with XRE-family HTH domain
MRAWERHEAGWTQKDSATVLGVSEGAVSQWFTKTTVQGEHALPTTCAMSSHFVADTLKTVPS